MIYFVQGESTRLIKIGFATDVQRRLNEIRTGSPDILVLLAAAEGGRNEEYALHRKFIDIRHHGEWFSPEKPLLDFIHFIAVNPTQAMRHVRYKEQCWTNPINVRAVFKSRCACGARKQEYQRMCDACFASRPIESGLPSDLNPSRYLKGARKVSPAPPQGGKESE